MATKKWWLAEEIRVIVPDFDERVAAHQATLPPKARPQSEVARLREEVARLKALETTPVIQTTEERVAQSLAEHPPVKSPRRSRRSK